MPETIAKVVDVRTSRMPERIAAINGFVAAGYEVHAVIVHEGWEAEWKALFSELDQALSPAARAQLKCEVIFLTHNEGLHDLNLQWHPRAEEWLAAGPSGAQAERVRHGQPSLQEPMEASVARSLPRLAWRGNAVLRGALRVLNRDTPIYSAAARLPSSTSSSSSASTPLSSLASSAARAAAS